MKNALMDVFNDLRARRLLPVAAVLLVALVAAPIVLTKKEDDSTPATETTAPSQAQAPTGPEELAKVTVSDDVDQGSSLSAFKASNPFAPPKNVLKAAEADQTSNPGNEPTAPTTTGEAPSGDTGTCEAPPSGGEGGGTGGGEGGGEQTTEFSYVIDATFWRNGHRRTIKGMEKLDVLPSQVNPLLIFMGASSGGGNAVFLVDATLQTTGEGKCKPSHSECAFLSLGAGAEQEFTTEDGDSYRLRIDQIRKVKSGDESSDSGTAASEKKKSKAARAAVDGSAAPRRFVLPDLSDFVEVTGSDSTGDQKRR